MQTEDHPIDYNHFEGVIPEGEYGGGTVMIWDRGTWEPEVDDVDAALAKGDLKFTLHGKKLGLVGAGADARPAMAADQAPRQAASTWKSLGPNRARRYRVEHWRG